MSRLDLRTRTQADIRQIEVADFFRRELPEIIRSSSFLAVPGAREFGVEPMTIATDSGDWTLSLRGDSVEVSPGGNADTMVSVSDADFVEFINDLTTLQMLMNLKRLTIDRGSFDTLSGWETILRSLLDNRAFHTRGSLMMRDREGRPLDLSRSFTSDDSDEDMAHFLAETGFLHLSGWLDGDLMDEIARDMDRELPNCTTDDGSWWVTMHDGSKRPVRMIDFEKKSSAVARLVGDERFLRLGRLTDDGYVNSACVEALIKPLGVVVGTSDIPWHHDCAMGMHSYKCCILVVGISVTGAGPGASQLAVVPGSHRALMPKNRYYEESGLAPLTVATRAGDVTVHCSCTLHMAQVPTEKERKVLYTSFSLPPQDPAVENEYGEMWGRRDAAQRLASALE